MVKHLEREKCDLSFIVITVIEEAIAPNAAPRHTVDAWDFNCRMFIRFSAMVTEEVMPGRDVELANVD